MTEAEAIVNSLPLAIADLTASDSVDVLTPNRLLTMKSAVVLVPPGNFKNADVYSRKQWPRIQYLADAFWQQWKTSYLQSFRA